MSRIGKKLIPLPAGVKYKVQGNTVLVEGPKGKVSALIRRALRWKPRTACCTSIARTTVRPRCTG